MNKLALSPDLSLPIEAVTKKFAFLGTTGSGKTYAATKMAELMLKARAQIVALDPVGKWYGLRLGADGKSPGFKIPVFGGLYGDLPLAPTSEGGALIADVIVDRGISAILDVSQFEYDADVARFSTAFARRLYYRKKSAPSAIHLYLEECQEFLPQNPINKHEIDLLHEFIRISKIGRNHGFGVSLISQRPQEINKKALNLSEVVLAFQTNGSHERTAIANWVREKGADVDLIDTLPRLQTGHAHAWSPSWLKVSKEIRIAAKTTFDTSATPEVGAAAIAVRPLAPIDLAKLSEQMAATIEKAKQDDPAELRKLIADRDRTIAALERKKAAGADPQEILRIVAIERAKWAAQFRELVDRRLKSISRGLQSIGGSHASTVQAFDELEQFLAQKQTETTSSATPRAPERTSSAIGRFEGVKMRAPAAPAPANDGELMPSRRRVLQALADLAAVGIDRPDKSTVAAWANTTPTSSTYEKNMGALRSAGLLEYPEPGQMQITAAGRAYTSEPEIPTLRDLHGRWYMMLPPGRSKILRVLVDEYPESLTREQLSRKIDASQASSTFEKNLGALKTLGVVHYPTSGAVAATEVLFPEGLR